MNKIQIFFSFVLITLNTYAQDNLKLHYNEPAVKWTEALPVGNGRLGAMVFGGIDDELIQLNEATLWSGGPVKKNLNPKAYENLAPIRKALLNEDYGTAYKLSKNMQGPYSESFMPLGDLIIKQKLNQDKPENYRRELNIKDGITTTSFNVNGVLFKREVFASAPGECIIIRLTSSQKQKISVSIATRSQLKAKQSIQEQSLVLSGKAPVHADPNYVGYNERPVIWDDVEGCRGMRFELIVKPIIKDGSITQTATGIAVENSSEVVLIVSAATSFNGFDKCPDSEGKDEHLLAKKHLSKSLNKSYGDLLKAHLKDFHHFFDRVSLSLNPGETDQSGIPTDQRLEAYTKGQKDANLEALFFQYGRYLLLSSSRTKDAPANLQGIWNKELRAPWSSNYTTNINLQMNYWPVETANLSELFSPLNDLIKNLSVTGAETAKSYYHAKGWVVHHNSDIWAMSNPVGDLGKGDPMWANWYMGANWLSRHLWEHYQFTGDKKFLRQAYPILKGAASFTLDWLQKDQKGHLVTMPSTSPENEYKDGNKGKGIVTVASTMDMGTIADLFTNVITASTVLNKDNSFRDSLKKAAGELFPFQIGSKGQLQEWFKDFEDVDPHHRHTSHLYALHPAKSISPLTTPELADATRRTLEMRGDDGTGWSLAWKVNMWARLLDGNHAYKLFRNQLRLTKENDPQYKGRGGAYPNLFDAHPPFQIDGNFAGTAGVIELLMQSQNDEIHLLPALPDAWKDGAVKGIVARGNFVVDIKWNNGKMDHAKVLSRNGGQCTIRSLYPFKIESLNLKSEKSTIGYSISFSTKKNRSYSITTQFLLLQKNRQ